MDYSLPIPSLGDLPDLSTKMVLPYCRQMLYHLSRQGNPLTVRAIIYCGNFLKRYEYQTTIAVSIEACRQVKTQQLESDKE